LDVFLGAFTTSALARFTALAFGMGCSLTISDAGLSVRSPLNEPCRTRLSRVQPRNAICATSFGSRKCTPRAIAGGTSGTGALLRSSFLNRIDRSSSRSPE
jgi:hypothetical protein